MRLLLNEEQLSQSLAPTDSQCFIEFQLCPALQLMLLGCFEITRLRFNFKTSAAISVQSVPIFSLFRFSVSLACVQTTQENCRVRWGNLGLRGNLGLFAFSLLKRS